jgi:DGQHR domain-containing protein
MTGVKRGVEQYLGIERRLNNKRVSEIKQYVRTVDASFPSSVILAVRSKHTKYDEESHVLQVWDQEGVAKILDGQHRIAGLEGYGGPTFQLIVTIFLDMDEADQGMVFATINLEQKTVNKSLAYDLYELATSRSPQKTAHNIVRVLDSQADSPFAGKIKMLGVAGDPGEIISQAVFVDALLPLMSSNPVDDRDRLKRKKKLERASPAEEQILVFRNMFVDQRDDDIALVLWNYFKAVEHKWGGYWTEVRRGYVLNRTTGFRALMALLPSVFNRVAGAGEVPPKSAFDDVFASITLRADQITPENFPPGTSGQTKLRDMLMAQASLR